jgi:hypothetical protein
LARCPRFSRWAPATLFVGWALVLAACGGAPDTVARNRTFYDYATAGPRAQEAVERRFPALDLAESAPNPEYIGVTILHDTVRFSRPKNWTIREASNDPGRAYITYVSPHAYSFAVYERGDPPGDSWQKVLDRFEEDVASVGAKVLSGRVPIATWQGQGRAYSIERTVEGTKKPLISHSREVVLRGDHRFVLVQVVHEGTDMAGIDAELMRPLDTMGVP